MKGQVPQADGFQAEVDGTETEGITTLGFTMLITFGIEMSSETLISAAEEEKMNRAVACFLSFQSWRQLVAPAPCLVEFCISANWPQTSNQSTASAGPDLFVTDHSISITISARSGLG